MTIDDSKLSFAYSADSGESNRIEVTQSGTTVSIADTGASIDLSRAAGHCTATDVSHVTCNLPAEYAYKVSADDMDDTITVTGSASFKLDGGPGSDVIDGGGGDDKIEGGPSGLEADGDDIIRGGGGADKISGGNGTDIVDYSRYELPVSVSLDGEANDGAPGEGDDVDSTVEVVLGGGGDDRLSAGAGAASLYGGAGDDTLIGGNGNDTLVGGEGDDTLVGGAGDDTLDGGAGHDVFSGGDGADTLISRDGAAEAPVCGAGDDRVTADELDAPAFDCEIVDTPPLSRAAPVPGRSVGVAADPGSARVKLPGARDWVELSSASRVPVGSVIDARNGIVTLTSALDRDGNTQTGEFWGGVFAVRQKSTSPIVELALRGGDFSPCRRHRAATKSDVVASRRRARRRLWGRDRGGRFRTKGRHSVATVRGTRWLTEDRCGGTLTRVTEGAVSVRALGGRKKVLVRAGERYLARRR